MWGRTSSSVTASVLSRPEGGFRDTQRSALSDRSATRNHAVAVDAKAEGVLRRFVDMLGGEVEVTYFNDGGAAETVREIHELVTNFLPEQGVVELERHREPVRLRFEQDQLLRLLRDAGAERAGACGGPLSDEETAASWLTVYLEESIETQEADPTGWWVYEDHGFTPLHAWEVAAQRLARRLAEARRRAALQAE